MSETARHLQPALLVEYLEERLEAQERSRIESHLEACGTCRAESQLAREALSQPVDSDLGDHSAKLKESFRARLDARLEASSRAGTVAPGRPARRGPRRRTPWLSRGLLAASIAVIAFGLVQLRGPQSPSDLGRTLRSETPGTSLSSTVQALDADRWEVRWEVDADLRDLSVQIVTPGGQLAFDRDIGGESLVVERSELGEFATAPVLFLQILGTDALGAPVRSQPVRLP